MPLSHSKKLTLSLILIALAATIVGYQLLTAQPALRGAADPYTAWCPTCDKDFTRTKEQVILQGVPDTEIGGWRIACPTCNTNAYAQPSDKPIPRENIRKILQNAAASTQTHSTQN